MTSVKIAVEAMRAGSFDYLTKAVDLEELAVVLDKAWNHARLQRELRYWHGAGRDGNPLDRIIGDSNASSPHAGGAAGGSRSGGAPAMLADRLLTLDMSPRAVGLQGEVHDEVSRVTRAGEEVPSHGVAWAVLSGPIPSSRRRPSWPPSSPLAHAPPRHGGM
jgi:hypothetical protein